MTIIRRRFFWKKLSDFGSCFASDIVVVCSFLYIVVNASCQKKSKFAIVRIRVRKLFLLVCVLLVISIGVNFFLLQRKSSQKPPETAQDFPFLSPRIFAQNQNNILINFIALRSKLNEYVSSVKEPLGLYFEYLPSGVSVGVNEKDEFVLVSLLKVPVVMAVYKNVAQGTTHLSDMLTIADADRDNKFGNLYQKPIGTQISVEDAIKLTLIDSDNTAKNLLGHTLTNDDITDVFDYLDIPKDTEGKNLVVSPKNYSSILRSLYLSSFVPKQYSEDILNFLTQSQFSDKLGAGIPTTIPVAHKIGVFQPDDSETPVYTDCGIVYIPHRPYILCIMTKSDNQAAQDHMKTISQIVYQYVLKAN